jgi:hypothetical protein
MLLRFFFIFFIGFFLKVRIISAQSIEEIKLDTLNKFDDKGKKNGYWIELINQKLEPVKRKKKAVLFRFVYFEHGIKLNNFNSRLILHKLHLESKQNLVQGKPILMDGEYKLIEKKQLLIIENYTQGKRSGIYKCYNVQTGRILELANYDKKFNSQEHSFYLMYEETDNGEFKSKAYYRKGEKGWGIYNE